MKYFLALILTLTVGSVAMASNCHQNVQRVVVDHCAQQVVAQVVQPYAIVVPLEVAYSHQNFVAPVVVDYYQPVVQEQIVQKQVVRQVNRVGLIERLRNRQQALRGVRQQNRAKNVIVEKQVVVRQRNLVNNY